MPSAAIKTIRDLIFYQYAKIIALSAQFSRPNEKPNYKFIMDRVQKLSSGEIKMSAILREMRMQMSSPSKCCEYCGATENLSWDHLIPKVRNGADDAENQVLACRSCNSSKGAKGIYQWYGIERKDELPRLVAGKYLKLLHDIHEVNGTLDSGDLNGDGKLNVLDLEVF